MTDNRRYHQSGRDITVFRGQLGQARGISVHDCARRYPMQEAPVSERLILQAAWQAGCTGGDDLWRREAGLGERLLDLEQARVNCVRGGNTFRQIRAREMAFVAVQPAKAN